MNKDEMLKSLMALDFMAVDLGLYLDTHPEDEEAIAEYDRIIKIGIRKNTVNQIFIGKE